MELNIINMTEKTDVKKKINLSSEVFDKQFNEPLVHQVVTSYLSNKRTAVKAEKNRAQVRGGGIKPFRQKGTGKARAGSIRSPLWKGGGKTFVASEKRNYKKKINKKMYKQAMRCIFSELIVKKRLLVIDHFSVVAPKTKNIVHQLEKINALSGLLILNEVDKNIKLSSNNIPNFIVEKADNISPLILIKYSNIIVTVDGLKKIEGLLK